MKNVFILSIFFLLTACDSLVSISDPLDKIPSSVAFSTDQLADAAMNGVYQSMLNPGFGTPSGFASGDITKFGALAADELVMVQGLGTPEHNINTNKVVLTGSPSSRSSPTDVLWSTTYNVIYGANAVIEGIAASTSGQLRTNMRKTLTAEAKFVRAFCYFYLVNFFGDVPLVLTTDYNTEITRGRDPRENVYRQMVQDLKEAEADLPVEYPSGNSKRVRANKWAATALLARVYLFTGDYASAAAQATKVINNTSQYTLEPSPGSVFLTSSREAVWQFDQQTTATAGNATPDGAVLLPYALINPGSDTAFINYIASSQLLQAFEPEDTRRKIWIDSAIDYHTGDTRYFVSKYRTGQFNRLPGGTPTEYAMMLRLAEQYLIRAEAAAHNGGGVAEAVSDLNIIRGRAGLPGLPASLTPPELLTAIAHEWQTEFFCEWGIRWFNLKRTGKAVAELSNIPLKQPWAGDHQLLYPIPPADIRLAPKLQQNPGY